MTENTNIEKLDQEADIAADYIEEMLDIADISTGDFEIGVRGDHAIVNIVASEEADQKKDLDALVGENGEVLQALQDLARLAVTEQTGEYSRLLIDINGWREKRSDELKKITEDAIAEVQKTGKSVKLDPMNSFERKLVHDIIRDSDLESDSAGTPPKRAVVISLPKEKDDEAQEPVEDDAQEESVDSEE